jgi:hypothetical protein
VIGNIEPIKARIKSWEYNIEHCTKEYLRQQQRRL